jgi:hypothetical protein
MIGYFCRKYMDMDTSNMATASPDSPSSFREGSLREELERHGVVFDEDGQPEWYTVPEWFDELDRKLTGRFGEEYRELANKRRSRWNVDGAWQTFPVARPVCHQSE